MYNPQLDTFIKVADAGSFNKAAEALFISPPAVIKQINLLESSLSLRLFERSHRGLTLTKAGQSLYRDAKYLIKYSQESIERARSAMQEEHHAIRFGSSPTTPVDLLLDLWPKLRQVSPDIQFRLIPFENTPENAREILRHLGEHIDVVAGVVDEGMLAFHSGCCVLVLAKQPVELMMPLAHPLAKKNRLTWEDLAGETIQIMHEGWSSVMDRLRDDIRQNHPDIHIKTLPFYNMDAFNACANGDGLVLGFPVWENLHPLVTMRAVDWEYALAYGIFYSPEPSEAVRHFLKAVRTVLALDDNPEVTS